jgi:protein-disulfide isomerase-like protein with CxxC motif
MAHEHLEDLRRVRSALVDSRRAWAKTIAAPGAKTDQMLTTMTAIQDAIEAIDRAIEDERKGR